MIALTSFQVNLLAYTIIIISAVSLLKFLQVSSIQGDDTISGDAEDRTTQDPEKLLEAEIQEEIARINEGEDPLGPLQKILQRKK